MTQEKMDLLIHKNDSGKNELVIHFLLSHFYESGKEKLN